LVGKSTVVDEDAISSGVAENELAVDEIYTCEASFSMKKKKPIIVVIILFMMFVSDLFRFAPVESLELAKPCFPSPSYFMLCVLQNR